MKEGRIQLPHSKIFFVLLCRYRPWPTHSSPSTSSVPWQIAAEELQETTYVLEELTYGEHFQIEVDTVSHHVASGRPLIKAQTIKPQAIAEIEPILGAENVTLRWALPQGRVDVYRLKWYPLGNPEDVRVKSIAGDQSQVSIQGLLMI